MRTLVFDQAIKQVCPNCGGDLALIQNSGKFCLRCTNFPDCIYREDIKVSDLNLAAITPQIPPVIPVF